jgi:3-hydroxyisobutyrate dehydrogenase-like beta-hydroxyacid dehydrogenase
VLLEGKKIIDDFSSSVDCSTPLFSRAAQVYETAMAQGRENQDTSAVFAVLEGLTRTKEK